MSEIRFVLFFTATLVVCLLLNLARIESKIDALSTCGPAEVVVSGEGE